jgi:cysteine desulfurase
MQKRAGTENVAGIVGTGVALALADQGIAERRRRVGRLRDRLRDGILAEVAGAVANESVGHRLPNNLNVSFEDIESEALVAALDERGIAASSGSACSNSTWEPSHVLMAMGVPIRRASASVRFSLGEATTAADIDHVLGVLPGELVRLRGGKTGEPLR